MDSETCVRLSRKNIGYSMLTTSPSDERGAKLGRNAKHPHHSPGLIILPAAEDMLAIQA